MPHPPGRLRIAATALVLAYAPTIGAVQLDWQAPPGCPTADALVKDVNRLAGSTDSDGLAARAIVMQTGNGRWQVAIDLSGSASGHRTLTADNCPQLARASALIIALAANPEAALDLTNEDPAPVQPTPNVEAPSKDQGQPASSSPPTNQPAPTPITKTAYETQQPVVTGTPPLAKRFGFDMIARAGYESGSLPTPTGWLGLGARASVAELPISGSLLLYVTQGSSATFAGLGVGANFRVFGAQAVACAEPLRRTWYLAGCGGLQLAMLRVKGFAEVESLSNSGFESAVTHTRYRWIAAPLLGIVTGYEVAAGIRADLGANLAIPTTRWQFLVENLDTVFRAPAMQYSCFFGLGMRLN